MRILSLLYVYFVVQHSQGTVGVFVPAPDSPEVSSNNFIHILKWRPGEGTQPGTVYYVQIGDGQTHTSGTSIDVSDYMKGAFLQYQIQLWASFGNSSSSKVSIRFSPYTNTIVGPPKLSLSGCGDCLHIGIELPNRQRGNDHFHNSVEFNIQWSKASDEKDECQNSLFPNSPIKYRVKDPYILTHLEPEQRYCVRVQPVIRAIPDSYLLSSCACEFTSQVQPRGGGFLAMCVVSAILLGSFLSFMLILFYAGFLCKPNIRLPKALVILVPGYILTPEETCISTAEVECGIQVQKPSDLHKKNKENWTGLNENNDNVDEDDDYEDGDSHSSYMDRAGHVESEYAGSKRSAFICDVEENSGKGIFEATGGDAKETSLLSQCQYHGAYKQAPSLDSVKNLYSPPIAEKGNQSSNQMQERREEEKEDPGNVNLWSVVLKSMVQDKEEADDPGEAGEPLLPLSPDTPREAKPQTGSCSELNTALLYHTRTELQSCQEDTSDMTVYEQVRTGYMASHTGIVDKASDLSDDCTSDYMTR